MINREPIPLRQGSGIRRLLTFLIVGVFVVLMFARWAASMFTDYLWYDSLDVAGVWTTLTFTRVWLVLGATLVAFIFIFINLWLVDRLSPREGIIAGAPDEELLERYQEWIEPRTMLVRTGFSFFFALLLGLGAAAWWRDWLSFINSVTFDVVDPIFENDIALYVFELPFYRDLFAWSFQLLLMTTLIVVAVHYLNGGIRIASIAGDRASGGVKAHISVLLALVALLKAVAYQFDKWELLYSPRGQVFGASHTDVNAQIPALNLLIFISIVCAVIMLVNTRFRGWTLPAVAVGIWLVTSIGVGGIYPAMVQRFSVEPNEIERETPYVQHNLDFTRYAFGIEDVEVRQFVASPDLTAEEVQSNSPTIENIRLWDPGVLADTYPELQNIKTYYTFDDIDVDRYTINGELKQVMTAARSLDEGNIPGEGWVNERLVYTHGLGAVLSPAGDVTSDGFPDFLVKDLPPANLTDESALDIDQPRIYFSDDAVRDFLIVGSNEGEVDLPRGGEASAETATNSYDGEGGVELGNFFNRAAWALRFGDLNTLISSQVDGESRVMIARNIQERVEKVAPFLYADSDPYMVVADGKLMWIMDLYTVSDRIPYSELSGTSRLNRGSSLPGSFNYIRNSVKAVVDAYDGTIDLYVIDPSDPLIKLNERIFPDVFQPMSDFPANLIEHLRYPEDLFRMQTDVYTLYHMTDPVDLFQRNDPWEIARDPSTSSRAELRGTFSTKPMLPYYLLMELPEENALSFLLMQPFTPLDRPNMSAFVVAKSGPLEEYGRLIEYTMPSNRQIDGPGQVGDFIDQDPIASAEFTLLGQEGSEVIRGNMLVVPIEDSLLYVQPIYLAADTGGSGIPQFKRVVASFNSRIEIGESLDTVLVALFGEPGDGGTDPGDGGTDPGDGSTDPGDGGTDPGDGTVEEQIAQLLEQAAMALEEADQALQDGDLGTYQDKVEEAAGYIEQANELAKSSMDEDATGESAGLSG